MAGIACSLFPSHLYEEWIKPPFEEGRLQFAYAFFQNQETLKQAPSLVDRVIHLIAGALLMIPIVNWVVYYALHYFNMTIGGRFLEAVQSGNGALVGFYLDLGIDLNLYGNNLLYESESEEIVRALLAHGVSPHLRSTTGETFPESLITRRNEDFLRRLIAEGLIDFDPFLTEELFLKAKYSENTPLLKLLIEKGYEGKQEDFEGLALSVPSTNPLVEVAFNHDILGIQRLAREKSFQEFCLDYVALKTTFPKIQTDWMWDVLFRISPQHLRQFKDIGEAPEVTQPPPVSIDLSTMINLFDRINFTDPSAPHYMSESSRKETFDSVTLIRSPAYLREGLVNIREKITGSKQDETGADAQEMRDHRVYLEWVIYYLQLDEPSYSAAPLDPLKASVLIDLGKAGQVCSGRYKELFYECRCRLSKEEIKALSFEEQVMVHLGTIRSFIIYQIVHEQAKGCTHARDNLLFHLKERRGIPGDKPKKVFAPEYGGIEFTTQTAAENAFDPLYTPARMIGHIVELLSSSGQKALDFNNLTMTFMNERFAPRLQEQKLVNMRGNLAPFMKERMQYDALEELFQAQDPEFELQRPGVSVADFFIRLNEDPLLAPFGEFFTFPEAPLFQEAFSAQIREKKERFHAFMKLFAEDPASYERLQHEKESAFQAFDEAQKCFEERLEKGGKLATYQHLKKNADYGTLSTSERESYRILQESYASSDYQRLKDQADASLGAFGELCMEIRRKIQAPSEGQVQSAKRLLGISEGLPFQGLQVYSSMQREITSLESGSVSAALLKQAFIDQAERWGSKKNLLFAELRNRPAFLYLYQQLGFPEMPPGLDLQGISSPTVKKYLAACFAELIFTVSPHPVEKYFKEYEEGVFTHLVRPLHPETQGPALPERIHPIAVGMLLRELGYLDWRSHDSFRYSFMNF